jgi:multisubunit Na+/H+ antiporter MnhF subunit
MTTEARFRSAMTVYRYLYGRAWPDEIVITQLLELILGEAN